VGFPLSGEKQFLDFNYLSTYLVPELGALIGRWNVEKSKGSQQKTFGEFAVDFEGKVRRAVIAVGTEYISRLQKAYAKDDAEKTQGYYQDMLSVAWGCHDLIAHYGGAAGKWNECILNTNPDQEDSLIYRLYAAYPCSAWIYATHGLQEPSPWHEEFPLTDKGIKLLTEMYRCGAEEIATGGVGLTEENLNEAMEKTVSFMEDSGNPTFTMSKQDLLDKIMGRGQ
jgi:hypothetical protein